MCLRQLQQSVNVVRRLTLGTDTAFMSAGTKSLMHVHIMNKTLHSSDRKTVIMTVLIFFSRLGYALSVRRNSTHS